MKKKSRKNLSLIKTWSPTNTGADSIVLEDLFEQIEVVPADETREYSVIKLNKLQEGTYRLYIKKVQKFINITVHRGQYWDSDSFILKRNCLFENRAPLKMIKIAKVSIAGAENDKQRVTLKLEDYGTTARVHAYACHYLPNAPGIMFMSIAKKLLESGAGTKTVFPFAQWKNILMSNRELSDEFRYVFDRKYAERYLGNTLDRPKLLLKRNFVQKTQVD